MVRSPSTPLDYEQVNWFFWLGSLAQLLVLVPLFVLYCVGSALQCVAIALTPPTDPSSLPPQPQPPHL